MTAPRAQVSWVRPRAPGQVKPYPLPYDLLACRRQGQPALLLVGRWAGTKCQAAWPQITEMVHLPSPSPSSP